MNSRRMNADFMTGGHGYHKIFTVNITVDMLKFSLILL